MPSTKSPQGSLDNQPNFARRRAVALGGVVGLLLTGAATANRLVSSEDSTPVTSRAQIEAPVDDRSEQEAVNASEVWQGTLTIREGANIRHDPRVKNKASDGTDFTENLAYTIPEGRQFSVENPIVYKNEVDGRSYFGFTAGHEEAIPGEREESIGPNGETLIGKPAYRYQRGVYWVAADLVGDGFADWQPSQHPDEELIGGKVEYSMNLDSPIQYTLPDSQGFRIIAWGLK